METFWNKLNEKTSVVSETPSPIPAYIQVPKHERTKEMPKVTSETKSKIFHSTKKVLQQTQPAVKISSSESDSLSETESNRQILSDNEISEEEEEIPVPAKDKTQRLMDEPKTKIQERKVSSDDTKKSATKILISSNKNPEKVVNKPKLEKVDLIQKPVVTKVFSKPLSSQTGSESESSSESESESEEEESDEEKQIEERKKSVIIKNKPKIKEIRKETPIQRQFLKR